jgi:hypothetical protein
MNTKILRYVAYNGEAQPASYSAGLGDKQAKAYAIQNASSYGGVVIACYSDGESEVIRDYRRRREQEPAAGSV